MLVFGTATTAPVAKAETVPSMGRTRPMAHDILVVCGLRALKFGRAKYRPLLVEVDLTGPKAQSCQTSYEAFASVKD
ncbi:hypothetical protein [Phaffia rhodozyma]|uniref:Uncharacterized protein n=1 Tax=Phaffia rhodozyma TaxID=264483 RepID=A0A0F7SLR7_PHARH|nr:hypothetical protein [Phaffia rhodozyma]